MRVIIGPSYKTHKTMTKQQIESLKKWPIRSWVASYSAFNYLEWTPELLCNVGPDWCEDFEDEYILKGRSGRVLKFIGTYTQAVNYFSPLIKALG